MRQVSYYLFIVLLVYLLFGVYSIAKKILDIDISPSVFYQIVWGLVGAPTHVKESIVNFLAFSVSTYETEIFEDFQQKELDVYLFYYFYIGFIFQFFKV